MFKKIALILLIFLFAKSILHDLSVGVASNPVKTNEIKQNEEQKEEQTEKTSNPSNQKQQKGYQPITHQVQAGETVLSIAEKLNKKSIPIQKLLDDFQTLNPNTDPHQIQIGKTYFFPKYVIRE